MNQNLLTQRPAKALFFFCLPILMGNLFQQFYSMTDSIVVGKFVGASALAAVVNTFPITFLIICVAFGLANGASILIGQCFGADKKDRLIPLIVTGTVYAGVIGIILTAVGIFLIPVLLKLINTPDAIFPMSQTYLQIYFIGLVFTFVYTMFSSFFQALGDSKKPFWILVAATVINIVLDVIFVAVFNLSVAGVAFATIIAQAVSLIIGGILLVRKLERMEGTKIGKDSVKLFNLSDLKALTKLAIPTTAQEIAVAVGMFIMQFMVNGYGTNVIAGYTFGCRIENLGLMPILCFGIALTAYSSQNMGAGNIARIRKGYRAVLVFGFSVAALMAVVILFFGDNIISLFIGPNSQGEVIESLKTYLSIAVISFFFQALLFPAEGVMKGAGDVHLFLFIAVGGIVVKLAAGTVLGSLYGYKGVFLALPISWAIEALFTTARYFSGRWKTKGIL